MEQTGPCASGTPRMANCSAASWDATGRSVQSPFHRTTTRSPRSLTTEFSDSGPRQAARRQINALTVETAGPALTENGVHGGCEDGDGGSVSSGSSSGSITLSGPRPSAISTTQSGHKPPSEFAGYERPHREHFKSSIMIHVFALLFAIVRMRERYSATAMKPPVKGLLAGPHFTHKSRRAHGLCRRDLPSPHTRGLDDWDPCRRALKGRRRGLGSLAPESEEPGRAGRRHLN